MDADLRTSPDTERPHALVWIDSKAAIVVRWEDEQARIERVTSDIPDHTKSSGHLRHDPAIRHGGGRSQDAEESRRHEYLSRFMKDVTHRLPEDADLTVLGPGATHEHLVKSIRASDAEHHRVRHVGGRRSSRLTDRQLVALLRELEGDEAPRWTAADLSDGGDRVRHHEVAPR
jgi:hypothetical protein